MGLIDFFRRKKTPFENKKGEIHSETMENSSHKIEEIAKGESGIVKCEKCHVVFKLVDTIPVKNGEIKCPKCKVPIKVNLPDTPHLFPDIELEIDPETIILPKNWTVV